MDNIDCNEYPPKVTLYIDPANYEQQGRFSEKLFRTHSYHEFTHLIDRLNPDFKFSLDKQKYAESLKGGYVTDFWKLIH
jgi:hypothetical protein